MTPEERDVLEAAREWARVHRGCWPSTHIREPSAPGEGAYTMRDLRAAELVLLAAVERMR